MPSLEGDGHGPAPRRALAGRQPQVHGQPAAGSRRFRRVRRDLEGASHGVAIGRARGRRLSGDQSAGNGRHHYRRLDPERPRPGAGRSRDRQLAGLRLGAARLGASDTAACGASGRGAADGIAAAAKDSRGRKRNGRAAGQRARCRSRRQLHSAERSRPGNYRSERLGEIVPCARC